MAFGGLLLYFLRVIVTVIIYWKAQASLCYVKSTDAQSTADRRNDVIIFGERVRKFDDVIRMGA